MAVVGRAFVSAPTFTPSRYGLLSAAQLVDETEPFWRDGLMAQPDSCLPAGSWTHGCPSPEGQVKEWARGVPTIGADAFTVFAAFDCSPAGYSQDEITQRATAALVNGEERAVESVLWTGVTQMGTVNPHLTAPADGLSSDGRWEWQTAVEVPTTGLSPTQALGALEGALGACYGGRGVLHLPRGVAGALAAENALVANGTTLETRLGNLVVAGSGYPGDTGEMFATGAVAVRRSPVEVVGDFASSIDRSTNDVLRLAERTYAITWDCCLLSAQSNLP
jgi:hypothetical protein